MKPTQVNGGAVEVAETFLKALPDDEDDSDAATSTATVSSFGVTDQQGCETSAVRISGVSKKSKRFAPIALITEERAAELRGVLREMLIEFLELCRQLVLKTRTVLNVPRNAPMMVPRAVGEERTAEEVGIVKEAVGGGGAGGSRINSMIILGNKKYFSHSKYVKNIPYSIFVSSFLWFPVIPILNLN